jgi:hypothetical protein
MVGFLLDASVRDASIGKSCPHCQQQPLGAKNSSPGLTVGNIEIDIDVFMLSVIPQWRES